MDVYEVEVRVVGQEGFRLLKTRDELQRALDRAALALSPHEEQSEEVFTERTVEQVLKRCFANPKIIVSDWFRQFLESPSPTSCHSENHSITDGCLTAIEFILQPLDKEVAFVPRRKSFFIDIEISASCWLVWKYTIGSTTNIHFQALFQPITCSKESFEFEKERCLRQFDDYVVQESENSSVVEIEGVKKCCTQGPGLGTYSGSYHAKSKGIVRLVFDNSSSIFRGNYVEYRIQCVPECTFSAAEEAASDLAKLSVARKSALFEAIKHNSSGDDIDVVVDGPIQECEGIRTSNNQKPGYWLSSSKKALSKIYDIPLAGRLVSSTVTLGLAGYNSLSKANECSEDNKPSNNVMNSSNEDELESSRVRASELKRLLQSNPSDACQVCGSGSVRDMLHLARRIDDLQDQLGLEEALRHQEAAAARASLLMEMKEYDEALEAARNENCVLNTKLIECEKEGAKSQQLLQKQAEDVSNYKRLNIALAEKLESLQKEAGVWSVARGKVEEELFNMSDIREKENAQLQSVLDECSSLKLERGELLQRIAELESVSETASDAVDNEEKRQQWNVLTKHLNELEAEVALLKAQKSTHEKKMARLQKDYQEMVTSSRSELSEAKMLVFQYQEKMTRLKHEKKILVAELRSQRAKGLYKGSSREKDDFPKSGNRNTNTDVQQCSSLPYATGEESRQFSYDIADFCKEQLEDLKRRKAAVNESLLLDSENQSLQELSKQIENEIETIQCHADI